MRNREFPLTDLQGKVLGYVGEYMKDHLYPPTFKEIQEGLKINNPGSVYKVVVALARKGYIIRDKRKHRGIWPIDKTNIKRSKK